MPKGILSPARNVSQQVPLFLNGDPRKQWDRTMEQHGPQGRGLGWDRKAGRSLVPKMFWRCS